MDGPVSFAGLDLSPPGRYWLDVGDAVVGVRDPWDVLAARPVVEQPASVGLVCVCGSAVATIAGTTASCECGRVWMVSVMRIAGP